jgi:glycolate oxidase FAD binding subunit
MTSASLSEALPGERIAGPESAPDLMEGLRASGYGQPEAVIAPADVDEVAAVLGWATEEGIGVLPVASAARLRPRVVPASEGGRWIALRTDALAGIEIYEAADLTLTAGAGTSMRAIHEALRANGQWAPFDPPRALDRTLGGFVADGASGPLWAGYGHLRNHVLGMTVVTGDGRVLRLGGRVVKNVAGFDLLKPMTGSCGSLAVMTSVTLRAFPVPASDLLLSLTGASVLDLLPFALRAGTAPVLPVSIVVADVGEPRLVLRLHGAASTVEADRATLEEYVGRTFQAHTADEAAPLLEQIRDHATAESVTVETSVRPSRLPRLLENIQALAPASMVVDSYEGRLRWGFPSLEDSSLERLHAEIARLDGAVRVIRGVEAARRLSESVAGAGSRAEARIVDRLRATFDPAGVFWPARRS